METGEGPKSIAFIEPDTSLAGTRLVNAPGIGPKVSYDIATFIYRRLVAKKADFKWTERRNPLGTE